MHPWLTIAALSAALMLSVSHVEAADSAAEQVIEVHAKKFDFAPAEITLKKGVPVKLKLVSDDVEHSLVISTLHVNQIMKPGEVSEVEVTPTETGDFKGVCGKFCGLGHGKMVFIVHVVSAE